MSGRVTGSTSQLAAALAVAALVSAGVGCGSSDESTPSDGSAATVTQTETVTTGLSDLGDNSAQNDYVDRVNEIQQEIADAATSASAETPSTPAEAAVVGHKIADAFSSGADDLAAIDPPEEVADVHAQLQEELSSVADDIGTAADTFEGGNAQEAAQAAVDLQQSVTEAQTTVNELIDEINSAFSS